MLDFSKRTAIVTGSARGIGKIIAESFARLGATVIVSDIDQASCDATASAIAHGAVGIRANVTNADEVSALFDKVVEKFGQVDIVVNNAGVTRDALMIRMDEKDWDLVLDINLKGAFLVTKTAARLMMKQRYGRIINISSVVGLGGNAGQANYSASKAGLLGLTKSAARELGARNITVNAVAPGYIETEMTAHLSDTAKEYFMSQLFIGRPGSPQDVANAVLFFASEEASYITGQVLAVDGGMTM